MLLSDCLKNQFCDLQTNEAPVIAVQLPVNYDLIHVFDISLNKHITYATM